jgi:hypothetical protein
MTNKTQAEFIPPTTYNDNVTPIPPGAIDKFVLSIGTTPGGPYPVSFPDTDITPNAEGKIVVPLDVLGVLAPNTYYGVVYAHTAAGQQSAPSNEDSFTVEAPVLIPNPPTALKFV